MTESSRGIDKRSEEGNKHDGFLTAENPDGFIGDQQKEKRDDDFQKIDAEKCGVGDAVGQRVEHVEVKSLLLIDVSVKYFPVDHGFPNSEKAVCIDPIV